MQNWNHTLFLFLNGSAHPSPIVLAIAIILADSPPMAGSALLVGLWVWGAPGGRGGLLTTAAAVLLAQGMNLLIGLFWFEPRPFVIGLGHTLMVHAPDNAFPSDHATFVWTLGASLIATGAALRWGVAVCVYGLGVAWARIFLGVHFPDDMVASALVAIVCAGLARTGEPIVALCILPPLDDLYEASLRRLRLPPALIPRRRLER